MDIYVNEKGDIFGKEQEGVYRSVIYDVMHIYIHKYKIIRCPLFILLLTLCFHDILLCNQKTEVLVS